jgi:hypothetical protein
MRCAALALVQSNSCTDLQQVMNSTNQYTLYLCFTVAKLTEFAVPSATVPVDPNIAPNGTCTDCDVADEDADADPLLELEEVPPSIGYICDTDNACRELSTCSSFSVMVRIPFNNRCFSSEDINNYHRPYQITQTHQHLLLGRELR